MAQFYLVPTPIGNLDDISLRALKILEQSDFILAEDTRQSGKLLMHHGIQKPLIPFHQHNEHKTLKSTLEKIKQASCSCFISDAGTPGISDPGYSLAKACIEEEIEFSVLPGATALIPALVLSGFPLHHFSFFGFPPHKKGRKTFFENLLKEDKTVAFYESTHRLLKSLQQLQEMASEDLRVAVVKEISKMHERVIRGAVSEVIQQLEEDKMLVKGEFVVVVNLPS